MPIFLRWTLLVALVVIAAVGGPPSHAVAQSFPYRPIQVIVPFAPGGPSDMVTRLISEQLSRSLGQPVIVENRAGGGGMLAVTAMIKAQPTGYTLLAVTSDTFI